MFVPIPALRNTRSATRVRKRDAILEFREIREIPVPGDEGVNGDNEDNRSLTQQQDNTSLVDTLDHSRRSKQAGIRRSSRVYPSLLAGWVSQYFYVKAMSKIFRQ